MKFLNGAELAGFIQERQAKQVRALRQSWKVFPKLVIFTTTDNPVTEKYINLKKNYAEEILVDVDVVRCEESELKDKISDANSDENVHGIIVQLPLKDVSQTDEILSVISEEKDVDGLNGKKGRFVSATATAIQWLLAGYGVDVEKKRIAIVGNGRLVGKPFAEILSGMGVNYDIFEEGDDLLELKHYSLIITATGVPGLITNEMVADRAVIVDAGVANDNGVLKGDVADEVRERKDIIITPEKGGVGPLTIAALIDNVINSARKVADKKGQQDL